MKTVTQEEVNNYISSIEDFKLGKKTTVVLLTLANGFEVIGTSACIDPENYNHEIGIKYARERAESEVWKLLAFVKQTEI